MNENKETPAWRSRADIAMFALGFVGAAWELFYDRSTNYLAYLLIFGLLKGGQYVFDTLEKLTGPKK